MNKYELRTGTNRKIKYFNRKWICKYEEDDTIRWEQISKGWQIFRTEGELTLRLQKRYPTVLMEWHE